MGILYASISIWLRLLPDHSHGENALNLRVAGVDATRGARFANHDLAQRRQRALKLLPNPTRDVLAGWIFQALHLVEVTVVDLLFNSFECPLDDVKVHDPAEFCIERALHMDFDVEAMTVQSTAFVSSRN